MGAGLLGIVTIPGNPHLPEGVRIWHTLGVYVSRCRRGLSWGFISCHAVASQLSFPEACSSWVKRSETAHLHSQWPHHECWGVAEAQYHRDSYLMLLHRHIPKVAKTG